MKQPEGSERGILKVSNTILGDGVCHARNDNAPSLACKKSKKKHMTFAVDPLRILDGVTNSFACKSLLKSTIHIFASNEVNSNIFCPILSLPKSQFFDKHGVESPDEHGVELLVKHGAMLLGEQEVQPPRQARSRIAWQP